MDYIKHIEVIKTAEFLNEKPELIVRILIAAINFGLPHDSKYHDLFFDMMVADMRRSRSKAYNVLDQLSRHDDRWRFLIGYAISLTDTIYESK